MKSKIERFYLLFISILVFSINSFGQPKIIFDTDFGGDADDLGALVMLHNFIDKNECDLLAIMSWSPELYTVPAIEAINRYYKHPNIPIGTRKDSTSNQNWTYSKSIAERFPYELTYNKAPNATLLYRKILAESMDSSIIIVTVGPLKNIEYLIKSRPDSTSKLSGKELIEKKVKEFVIMGGKFPVGDWEWNFDGGMPGVTKYVIKNIDVPITFSGFEVGQPIKTSEIFNEINSNTPLYIGFMHFSKHASWMKDNFEGKILDNASFDQTAVLYAVRNGVGVYWDKVINGICLPDERGGNIWKETDVSKHSYLKLKSNEKELSRIIESIMLGDL